MIDCKELNERVRTSGDKKKHLAHAMGITANTLRNKLTGKSAFKLEEAQQLSFLLGLSADEQERCFWRLK